MTVAATAPTGIKSLATILAATSAWSAVADASKIYYDKATGSLSGYWAALNMQGGLYLVQIYCSLDGALALLEELGYALQYQLPTRYRTDGTGLYIGQIPPGDIYEPDDSDLAGAGAAQVSILLSFPSRIEEF